MAFLITTLAERKALLSPKARWDWVALLSFGLDTAKETFQPLQTRGQRAYFCHVIEVIATTLLQQI